MIAAPQGNIDIVNSLIEKGANLDLKNNDGNTALMFVASNGNFDRGINAINIVKALIEKGANLDLKNNNGETADMVAIKYSNTEIVKTLTNASKKDLETIIEEEPNETEGGKKTKRKTKRSKKTRRRRHSKRSR